MKGCSSIYNSDLKNTLIKISFHFCRVITVVVFLWVAVVRVFPVTVCHAYYELNKISPGVSKYYGVAKKSVHFLPLKFKRTEVHFHFPLFLGGMAVKYLLKKEIWFFLCMWMHVMIIFTCFSFSALPSLKMRECVRKICHSNSGLLFICVSDITFLGSY